MPFHNSNSIKNTPKISSYNLFFSRRFYVVGAFVVFTFVLSWLVSFSLEVPKLFFVLWALVTFIDFIFLFANRTGIKAKRTIADRFSNGEYNPVQIDLKSYFSFATQIEILEELPEQLQARHQVFNLKLDPRESNFIRYEIRPKERGVYQFGFCNLMIRSKIGMVSRRIPSAQYDTVKVYPSYKYMRRYTLVAHSAQEMDAGNKKLRKIGHSLEFEQIKEYVRGDDIRSLNWKATARKGALMANHFVDEKSQQVYVIIDKGRLMKMPFRGLTLLDYAINATLILANVSLYRQDKFGLMTFSHVQGTVLPAQRKGMQMNLVLEALYNQETDFLESDFERLYLQVRTYIKHRSLLVLFTQFETMHGLKRQLPYLKQLAKHHLLLVVFFENSELTALAGEPAEDLEGIYTKTIAEKFSFEKKMIVKELRNHGIISMLTPPENLTINTVNKYLELKSKQML